MSAKVERITVPCMNPDCIYLFERRITHMQMYCCRACARKCKDGSSNGRRPADSETRICLKCSEPFETKVYTDKKFCGLTCSKYYRGFYDKISVKKQRQKDFIIKWNKEYLC